MKVFPLIDRGHLFRCEPGASGPLAVMSRCAVLPGGGLLASYCLVPALAVNGFVTVLSRSSDDARTWSAPENVWPDAVGRWSIGCSISGATDGRLFLYGFRTPIEAAGESMWCEATQGIKQNELIWSTSDDRGVSWREPAVIPRLLAGSVEVPGALCVTRRGAFVAPYSPYATFDPALPLARNQVIAVRSEDGGANWQGSVMLRFEEENSGGAEAWCVELSDGRLVGVAWHIDISGRRQFENKYAVSDDGGATWSPTRTTGTLGNTTVLCPLEDGRVLFGVVERRPESSGIRLAIARPTAARFGIEAQELVYQAARATQSGGQAQAENWADFAFGEPSLTVLHGQEVLLTYWSIEQDFRGIRWLRFRLP